MVAMLSLQIGSLVPRLSNSVRTKFREGWSLGTRLSDRSDQIGERLRFRQLLKEVWLKAWCIISSMAPQRIRARIRDCAFPLLVCVGIVMVVVYTINYQKDFIVLGKEQTVAVSAFNYTTDREFDAKNAGPINSSFLISTRNLNLFGCDSINADLIHNWTSRPINSLSPAPPADCRSLESGNHKEVVRINQLLKNWKHPFSDEEFYLKLTNCTYVQNLFFNNYYVSDRERNFPLGFVVSMHTELQQVVRFLRVIYRPHNVYCLHPDAKAGKKFANGFRHLTSCLPNVIVPDNPLKVTYKHSSIMESQLLCMSEIQQHFPDFKWKYMMILCGRELPFSSNRIIVDVLHDLNGASIIGPRVPPQKEAQRRLLYKNIVDLKTGRLLRIPVKLGKPPHNIKIYKSSNYVVLSREFVKFIFTSQKALDFRHYMQDVRIAEEFFFASLYKLPEAPKGDGSQASTKVIVAKQYWTATWNHNLKSCPGKIVHYICILTTPDLPRIIRDATHSHDTTYFFFNKYFMEDDPVIMDCIERRLLAQNIQDYHNDCTRTAVLNKR